MSLRSVASKPLSAVVFLTALVAVTFYLLVIDAAARPLIDFEVYLQAGRALLAGESIYGRPFAVTDRAGRTVELLYLYPPLLAQLLSKIAGFDMASLKLGWCVVNYLSVWLAILAVSRLVSPSWWGGMTLLQRVCVVAFFTFSFEPLYVGLGDGQVTALVLALLSLALVGALSGRDRMAGSALALAAHIKVTPVLLLIAPIVFRRWHTVAWFAAFAVLITLGTAADAGSAQAFADFARSALSTADEQSMAGFEHNIRLSRSLLGPFGLEESSAARWGLKVLLVTASFIGTAMIRRQPGLSYLRAFGFLVVFMILSSPIIWFHHLAWCLLPLAVVSMRPGASPDERMRNLTLALGLYFLLSQSYLLIHWTAKIAPALSGAAMLIPALVLFGLGALIYKQRAP